MPKLTHSRALLKSAHRQAVALNPNPTYTTEWPDRPRAYMSQRRVGVQLIFCLRTMERIYNTTPHQIIIDQLPDHYTALSLFLSKVQSLILATEEPKSKNNPKTRTATPYVAIWREYNILNLKPALACSMAAYSPAEADALRSVNTHQLCALLPMLDRCADLCLDFAPRFIPILESIHSNLSELILTIRPTWQLPKFKTQLLHPTHIIRPPAKYIKHRQFSDEWRQAQRKKWHKEQRDGN